MEALLDRAKSTVQGLATPVKVGSTLPSGYHLREGDPETKVDPSTFKGKNVLVFVPGAFTPPCSSQVPGYIEKAKAFKDKGVTGIYIISINDVFVTKAWQEKLGGDGLHFLADDTGAFTRSLGLTFDASALVGGERAKRAVVVVDNHTVHSIDVEDEAPSITVTAADKIIAKV